MNALLSKSTAALPVCNEIFEACPPITSKVELAKVFQFQHLLD
jgi:hypothetical protein